MNRRPRDNKPARKSQLFLDGTMAIDRVQNDWSETYGMVHLEPGRHPVKTTYCGDFDWMTLQ